MNTTAEWYREATTTAERNAVEQRRRELQRSVDAGIISGFTVHGVTLDGADVGFDVEDLVEL